MLVAMIFLINLRIILDVRIVSVVAKVVKLDCILKRGLQVVMGGKIVKRVKKTYVLISKKEDAIVVTDVDFHTTVLQVVVVVEIVVVVVTVHRANVLISKKVTAVEVKDVDFHMNK